VTHEERRARLTARIKATSGTPWSLRRRPAKRKCVHKPIEQPYDIADYAPVGDCLVCGLLVYVRRSA
jgi:hypothetical protein